MGFRFLRWIALPVWMLSVITLQAQHGKTVSLWLTTADRTSLLAKQPEPLRFHKPGTNLQVIEVNDKEKYQSMDGFGFALTGGSAQLLMRMSAAQRNDLLHELFGSENNGIAVSYLRVSIGSSDMNDHAFTYDDLPAGETDPSLAKFNLGPDSTTVIPILKEILGIQPSIKILGSPWSAPAWMKTNGALKNGNLKPEYYTAYAQYFVKYIETVKEQGIRIDAITVQNEPLNPHNTPSMVMQAEDQAVFIKTALGPAFHKADIKTKINVYDHNCDRPDYPLTILKDPEAQAYVDGSAFHLYEGEMSALTQVHEAYPKKNLYFTEQMTVDRKDDPSLEVARAVARLIVAAPRNWSRNVLLWNLAADPGFGPHTDSGGCPVCEGAITLDGDRITRNLAYYTVAQASKFVPPGSIRIASSSSVDLPNVAFSAPNGKRVVIVANPGSTAQDFEIRYHGRSVATSLKSGAVGTYVW
ncbi:glucosylceramidase [Silvibacterium bohemicum]|uniref:Glucosylceramidase n=1 Tax=Silvibacterium bohemicum TaxID=1577686 RepID=A0A841JQB3_9BACT|nr:glycoside hydrolase family 30 beta sandwich domain-containing protein [Silvibacterium bohemicum]MBB6143526.1 glucosylceramidase [Silvibacterium bohemicum]